jgi:hypothetical protein
LPQDSRLASKEFRKHGFQIIFAFPGFFFLRVVTPSDISHFGGISPGDSVCSL